MVSDLAERFADLDYPGRRKPVNRTAPVSVDTPVWDSRPVYYTTGGVRREFFRISDVAQALGYSVQSIRAWEQMGLLPRTPFRSPRTRRPVAAGKSTKGKRLWTRAQIEAILRLAKKHKVILNRKPPTRDFARDVAQAFRDLLGDSK
jgi:hypothetical protein